MTQLYSFLPLVSPTTTKLILGSMPGQVSLQQAQYYAHPRNNFWRFVEEIRGIPASVSYEQRCEALLGCGIGLWDVLQSCVRPGSLDTDIQSASIVPNDLAGLLQHYPNITTLCFNGAKAAQLFDRHIAASLGEWLGDIKLVRLPSTSPANASIPYATKFQLWQQALVASK